MMNSKPITQRAKSSPFKMSAADMAGPIASQRNSRYRQWS